jgi:uncharacterized heparinase superfamily protein
LGTQHLNDHRYLAGLGAIAWSSEDLARKFSGPLDEIFWVFGSAACDWLCDRGGTERISSVGFQESGFFIMRNAQDRVFIDCGPVGLGGRGGHGHNDCLSFEAALCGVRLITDCGAYVYTASAVERNRFRSTASHNTPRVDDEEINRFIAWNALWNVHYDAYPELRNWRTGSEHDDFEGSHAGYVRLPGHVRPIRRIQLDHASHSLRICDSFEGSGSHKVEIPLHFDPSVEVDIAALGLVRLQANDRVFFLEWTNPSSWKLAIEPCRVSPSYGVVVPSQKLVWTHVGTLTSMTIAISPAYAEAVKDESETEQHAL